jgi:hypothetical protein
MNRVIKSKSRARSMPKFCCKCGAVFADDLAVFCSTCGTRVEAESAVVRTEHSPSHRGMTWKLFVAIVAGLLILYTINNNHPSRNQPAPIVDNYPPDNIHEPMPAPHETETSSINTSAPPDPEAEAWRSALKKNPNAAWSLPVWGEAVGVGKINLAFEDNEVAAEAQFKSRSAIHGTVCSIETGALTGAWVELGVSDAAMGCAPPFAPPFAHIHCEFDNEGMRQLNALHKWQSVTFSGESGHKSLGAVVFNNCAVIKAQ